MPPPDDTLARARAKLAALRAAEGWRLDDGEAEPDPGPVGFVERVNVLTGRAVDAATRRWGAEQFRNAAPALLDLADAVAKWRPAYDRSHCHDSAVERMDSRAEAVRHLAAIDAALARLAGEA